MQRPLSRASHKTPAEALALLAEQVLLGKSLRQLAENLNQRKLKSGQGREFTPRLVGRLGHDYGLNSLRPPGRNRHSHPLHLLEAE